MFGDLKVNKKTKKKNTKEKKDKYSNKVTLGQFLKSINSTKENLMFPDGLDVADNDVVKCYNPFIVNRCLSYFPDTVLIADELNRLNKMRPIEQYKFLLYTVRKRYRFEPWEKKNMDDIYVVSKYFKYSYKKAEEAIKVLTKEQLDEIKKIMNIQSKGGIVT